MSKMRSHDPFGYLKHKLWPKERLGVRLSIWLTTTKRHESHVSLLCRWCATYYYKALNKGYNFSSNLTSIKGLNTKLWDSKVAWVPILGILGFPLGSPETKWHLGGGPMARHKEYYKGEGGGFPQVRAVVSLVSLCLPVAHMCTKSVPTTH
jgi:hypothetical protein